MKSRLLVLFGMVIGLLVLVLAQPLATHAGSWSVVTLDSDGPLSAGADGIATGVTAGTPFTIGFTVRQHGQRPMEGLSPKLVLTHTETSETVSFTALPKGAVGHYLATLTLPQAGVWTWQIEAFGPAAVMSPIQVSAPASSTAASSTLFAPLPLFRFGLITIALLGVGYGLLRRKRQPMLS